MDKLCRRFNSYQDGELSREERDQFLLHMAECKECSGKNLLLDNIARVLRDQNFPESRDSCLKISHEVYQRLRPLDMFYLYWPRPARAWAAFALLLLGVLSAWMVPFTKDPDFDAEYEMLMTDGGLGNVAVNAPVALTDDEIMRWLEQGGEIQ